MAWRSMHPPLVCKAKTWRAPEPRSKHALAQFESPTDISSGHQFNAGLRKRTSSLRVKIFGGINLNYITRWLGCEISETGSISIITGWKGQGRFSPWLSNQTQNFPRSRRYESSYDLIVEIDREIYVSYLLIRYVRVDIV
jgi:hypothetical protein